MKICQYTVYRIHPKSRLTPLQVSDIPSAIIAKNFYCSRLDAVDRHHVNEEQGFYSAVIKDLVVIKADGTAKERQKLVLLISPDLKYKRKISELKDTLINL